MIPRSYGDPLASLVKVRLGRAFCEYEPGCEALKILAAAWVIECPLLASRGGFCQRIAAFVDQNPDPSNYVSLLRHPLFDNIDSASPGFPRFRAAQL